MSTDAPKLSTMESIKEGSNFLKGTIDTEISEPIEIAVFLKRVGNQLAVVASISVLVVV